MRHFVAVAKYPRLEHKKKKSLHASQFHWLVIMVTWLQTNMSEEQKKQSASLFCCQKNKVTSQTSTNSKTMPPRPITSQEALLASVSETRYFSYLTGQVVCWFSFSPDYTFGVFSYKSLSHLWTHIFLPFLLSVFCCVFPNFSSVN